MACASQGFRADMSGCCLSCASVTQAIQQAKMWPWQLQCKSVLTQVRQRADALQIVLVTAHVQHTARGLYRAKLFRLAAKRKVYICRYLRKY